MDKKDFIFPGVILALVVVIGIGLLLTHSDHPTLVPNIATSTDGTAATSTSTTAPGASISATSAQADQAIAQPATPAPSSYYPYGSVQLALGQAAGFKDGSSIRPMRVLEDSRCPMGVMCIQAGTVKLSLKANGILHTIQIGQTIQVGNDSITLESVEPQRTQHGYPEPSAYRFTFSVKHG